MKTLTSTSPTHIIQVILLNNYQSSRTVYQCMFFSCSWQYCVCRLPCLI